jgi:hypothetical protein
MLGDEMHAWNRHFGVTLFNRCWELIESDTRTNDDDVEMLLTAVTSRWHWGQIGGPEEVATGDWLVAHVASLVGMDDLATVFATRNLATAAAEGWQGWRLASAHEGMARARAAAGDDHGRRHHIETARRLLREESDVENRQVIADQLDSVPPAGASSGT